MDTEKRAGFQTTRATARILMFAGILATTTVGAVRAQTISGNSMPHDTVFSALTPKGLVPQSADSVADVEEHALVQFGAVAGAPSGIALLAGYDAGPLAVKISGGSWGKNWSGFQGGLTYNVLRAGSLAVGVAAVAGEFRRDADVGESGGQQRYVGIACDCSLSGFFLQAGLANGPGVYSSTQFTFQFGYLWTL